MNRDPPYTKQQKEFMISIFEDPVKREAYKRMVIKSFKCNDAQADEYVRQKHEVAKGLVVEK